MSEPNEMEVKHQYVMRMMEGGESALSATTGFDRFIGKVKADALRKAADEYRDHTGLKYHASLHSLTEDYLNTRADRIEGES